MNRRNFLVNILLWILSFFFGYTIKKEGEDLNLFKTDARMVLDGDGKGISDKIGYLNEQLAETGHQTLKYSGIGTDQEIPISKAFPSVKLSDVQLLNPSATLSDSADWYVLQKLIYDADLNEYRRLNIPVGVFKLTKTLDFTQKLNNCVIEATGCIIKPSNNFTGELVKMSRGIDHGKCRNIRLVGLAVNGLFKSSVGVYVNDAQEWYLDNVKIYNCFIGLKLAQTWYGEFTGETIVQNCLVGIQTDEKIEVNTIDFSNTKVNFGYDQKVFFTQKNTNESDVDYNNRVVSIGVELKTAVNTLKFDGMTIEGMDYGIYSNIHEWEGTSVFNIDTCYFEAIKKEVIHLASAEDTPIMIFIVGINNCRMNGLPKVTLGAGRFNISGNEDFYLNVQPNSTFRTFIETDLPDRLISNSFSSPYLFIKHTYVPYSPNAQKYNNYGNNNDIPSQTNMLPTIQDELVLEHTPRIRTNGRRTANSQVFSVHTKPLTFVGNNSAPVIQGANGKYYMLSTTDGTALSMIEVKNLSRLDFPIGGMTSKELYRRTSITREKFYNVDIEQEVEFKDGVWKQLVGQEKEMISHGNTLQIATITSFAGVASYFSPNVWNVQINHGYTWQGSYWAWGRDWFGNGKSNVRAIGTIVQRPTNHAIDGFIYYATDESIYYKWSNTSSTYSTYTPLF